MGMKMSGDLLHNNVNLITLYNRPTHLKRIKIYSMYLKLKLKEKRTYLIF